MYFENEKDNIEGSQNIQDDAISWDSILDTDEDGIVSIKNNKTAPPQVQTEVFSNDDSIPDLNSIDIGDGLSVIDDGDDALDEDELKRILNSDDTEDAPLEYENTEDFDANNSEGNVSSQENIDIQNEGENITPRKEEKQKQQVSPVILALLFALIVAGASYLILNFLSNREDNDVPQVNTDALQQQQSDENIDQTNSEEANVDNIPVVNEEEVDSLKADEVKPEEKKEVVNVIPTGRIDPFLPLTKYKYIPPAKPVDKIQIIDKTINTIDYDHITFPKAPVEYGKSELNQNVGKMMTISVSGIMYDTQKPSAIITYNGDDYFVLIGDKLDSFKVVDIGPNMVKIAYGKNVYTAKIGEKFEIKDFYGNIKYKDGGRQYYSSMEEYYSINGIKPDNNNNFNNGYTSDQDIMIHNRN